MDFLAESHGRATSLRILSLFDTEFNEIFRVPDIVFPKLPPRIEKRVTINNILTCIGDKCEEEKQDRYDLEVSFDHAPANDTIFKHMSDKDHFLYTVEILPRTTKSSVNAVENTSNHSEAGKDELGEKGKKAGNITLLDLEPSKQYTIRVNTVVNGITLGSRKETIGPVKVVEDAPFTKTE